MSVQVSSGSTVEAQPGGIAPYIALAALLAAVWWLWASGMAEEILVFWDDIVYLSIQHIELVAWAGVLSASTPPAKPARCTDLDRR